MFECQILQGIVVWMTRHQTSSSASFLGQNDRQSLHYCSSPQPTEHFVSADMSVVKVEVLKGSLVKLMSMALSIMADIK